MGEVRTHKYSIIQIEFCSLYSRIHYQHSERYRKVSLFYESMSSRRRVLVTGIGLVTPLGTSKSITWQNLLKGNSGIDRISQFDTQILPVKIAGEVKREHLEATCNILPPTPAHGRFAIHAANEALRDASLNHGSLGETCGVSIGVGMSGLEDAFKGYEQILSSSPRRLSPYLVPRVLVNTAASLISITNQLTGPCIAASTACAAGLHAIIEAKHIVERGDVPIMLAGGAEAATHSVSIAAFARARALATGFDDDPQSASKPFDSKRCGFVLSEGAAVLVLECEEHARNRGVTHAYAELLGSSATADAFHITAPCPNGSGAKRAMNQSLKRSGFSSVQVDYVNAHATGTKVGDAVERRAIAHVLRDNDTAVVSATKGATGHLLGAAGAMEAAFTALTVSTGHVPPTLNLDNLENDEEVESNGWHDIHRYVPKASIQKHVDVALCNSFGFGGTNACVTFAAPNGYARRHMQIET